MMNAMVNDGFMCQECGAIIGTAPPGHPRRCDHCELMDFGDPLMYDEDTKDEDNTH